MPLILLSTPTRKYSRDNPIGMELQPPGMNKLVVNHLDKTIVTSDGATIVQELEVMHPAAKMVVMASQMQEQEAGDGTSLVVTLTGMVGALLGSVQEGGGRGNASCCRRVGFCPEFVRRS